MEVPGHEDVERRKEYEAKQKKKREQLEEYFSKQKELKDEEVKKKEEFKKVIYSCLSNF